MREVHLGMLFLMREVPLWWQDATLPVQLVGPKHTHTLTHAHTHTHTHTHPTSGRGTRTAGGALEHQLPVHGGGVDHREPPAGLNPELYTLDPKP